MKKSELERIIKEEVQNILKEGNVFPMWEDGEDVEDSDDNNEEKENDDELNESIKHLQKLAGIITEEYGVSKEAKSNDYYKKGMMSQQAEAYDMNTTAPDSTGMRTKWDYETFKKEIEITAPDSGVKQDNEGNIIVMLKQSRWYNPKHFKQLIKNYSNFIDPNPVPYKNENGFKGIMFKKKR